MILSPTLDPLHYCTRARNQRHLLTNHSLRQPFISDILRNFHVERLAIVSVQLGLRDVPAADIGTQSENSKH